MSDSHAMSSYYYYCGKMWNKPPVVLASITTDRSSRGELGPDMMLMSYAHPHIGRRGGGRAGTHPRWGISKGNGSRGRGDKTPCPTSAPAHPPRDPRLRRSLPCPLHALARRVSEDPQLRVVAAAMPSHALENTRLNVFNGRLAKPSPPPPRRQASRRTATVRLGRPDGRLTQTRGGIARDGVVRCGWAWRRRE